MFTTCDICDDNESKLSTGNLSVLPPIFQRFGQQVKFCGPARTVKVFEDNVLVRAALETQGNGQVLVVDGGGSLRCALVGGKLGKLAEENGWAGIVVNGCVRDSVELDACNVGIRALATHPKRSVRLGAGEKDLQVSIANIAINSGDWIYVDADGVVVSREKLHG
ncbi:ribonuclease E activity regulator RraA [Glaciimonas soli]|uniref:4-hydroxy-4-methyl-2-oxoglutarate aldolase n=1 Tax=Glaciimonas soli TaxID=2590999 RepID=A0A843YPY7_9BURK|nr:ribonuclease E activity regulator RraA [Glaciimonas soli]MQQ99602.1 ribonuclease E activity regulator RraA [Glaciimonas soli]